MKKLLNKVITFIATLGVIGVMVGIIVVGFTIISWGVLFLLMLGIK